LAWTILNTKIGLHTTNQKTQETKKSHLLALEMKTCILIMCVLLLATLDMSEMGEPGRVEGKMYKDQDRRDRMDVRRNVSWFLYSLCL
jgi:hypothetical protein